MRRPHLRRSARDSSGQALRRRLRPQITYLKITLHEFRVTIVLLVLFWSAGTALLYSTHPDNLSFFQALYGAMALFGLETAIAIPKQTNIFVHAMYIIYPVLGLTLFADAIVRVSGLVFSKRNNEARWFKVLASTYRNHVILCGLGQVGFRVAQQLRDLDEEVVVIEKDANAPHIASLKAHGIPVLVADARDETVLAEIGIKHAKAIVVTTDDDLANLEIALDARKLHPSIRVVLRMFDPAMAAKVADAFKIDVALSSSAIAAPIFAGAALSRGVLGAYKVEGAPHLVVEVTAHPHTHLVGHALSEVAARYGVIALARSHPAGHLTSPPDVAAPVAPNERLLFHGDADAIRALQQANHER